MTRQLTFAALALFGSASAWATAPAPSAAPHYRAELAAPAAAAADKLVVRDIVWRCGPGACVSGPSNSRPVTDCTALVRKTGPLKSFAVDGTALAADKLEKCNAVAR